MESIAATPQQEQTKQPFGTKQEIRGALAVIASDQVSE
jgi:hypothetical protein